MSLTFAEALQTLPVLSSAQVVAGRNGLERTIRWTHIVDHAEVLSWVRAGDLLLTTAYALKDSSQSELIMIEQLAQKGIAGILVSFGRYISEFPAETISAADALSFPIVVLPWEVSLAEVTQAIHERIISKQYELTEQIYHIHRVLSELVLQGGGLPALANRLSELLQCSVTIEDDALQLQAYASLGPMDEVRRRSIDLGATPKEAIQHLAASRLFDQLKADPKPQLVPTNAEIGMTLERIIAPILAGDDLYGYIWIIAGQRALSELELLAIERAAHIAALIISRERSVYAAEQRIKTRLFENLMDPYSAQSPRDLHEILLQFGLHSGFRVLVFRLQKASPSRIARLIRMTEQTIERENIAGTALEWGQHVVLIASTEAEIGISALAEKLLALGCAKGLSLSAGISAAAAEASRVRICHQQAVQALKTGTALRPGKTSIWQYDRLGYLPWLSDLPQEMRAGSLYLELVNQIREYDRETNNRYFDTLEIYLDYYLNTTRTAKALYIHRNTLLKRLNRIRDLWGIDFEDRDFILNLQIAIKDWRLSR